MGLRKPLIFSFDSQLINLAFYIFTVNSNIWL
jgi:hypothetical protein